MLKKEPSKEQMELVNKISKEIMYLAEKEGEMEICALMPFSLITTLIRVFDEHKSWDMLIFLADLISQLSTLIDEIDFPLDEL